MKRTVLALVLLVGLVAVPAMAQDFTSARPQFLSFSYGIPIGYSLELGEVVVGQAHNWSVAVSIMNNVDVGFDRISLRGPKVAPGVKVWDQPFTANLLRVQYHLNERLYMAFGFGLTPDEGSVLSIGGGGNFFQSRSASGYTFAMGVKIDYVALLMTPDSLSEGVVFLALRMTLGI